MRLGAVKTQGNGRNRLPRFRLHPAYWFSAQHDRDDYFNRMDCTECLTNRWSPHRKRKHGAEPLAGMKSRMSKLESKKWRRKLAPASRRLAVEGGG